MFLDKPHPVTHEHAQFYKTLFLPLGFRRVVIELCNERNRLLTSFSELGVHDNGSQTHCPRHLLQTYTGTARQP
jgi:hypothetical protein